MDLSSYLMDNSFLLLFDLLSVNCALGKRRYLCIHSPIDSKCGSCNIAAFFAGEI